ncbi:MAG: efflux RND transporter periplasmic adaptor subunit [Vicinamibacterales bacterium]
MSASIRSIHRTLAVAVACLAAACGRSTPADGPGGPPGGMPAMGVETVTLAEKPVEAVTEYIGTVKSRRSTTIQPQVEGFLTRIAARSGDRVAVGALLMEIDAGRQQATVANLEAQRGAREADLVYWKQQTERLRGLLDAGAVSQQEYDQAAATLRSGQAQLEAIESQIREQRVELGYHRVVAPVAGVVGDVPVRVGDRVTQSTVLTTLDDNQGLEVYVQVPVQQAPSLAEGLPMRIVDDRGQEIMATKVTFVAPSVDPQTQTVLAKAALAAPGDFRTDQFVRARIVWRSAPGLTVPVVAVTRVNGRFFAFVAEAGEGGATVARQRPIELGPLTGNDYVVEKGLAVGDRLIVSGVQKIGDGMPVAPAAAEAPVSAGAPAAR